MPYVRHAVEVVRSMPIHLLDRPSVPNAYHHYPRTSCPAREEDGGGRRAGAGAVLGGGPFLERFSAVVGFLVREMLRTRVSLHAHCGRAHRAQRSAVELVTWKRVCAMRWTKP